jgi:prepilin-type N-terminal cleavage/methylation domain-containing protein
MSHKTLYFGFQGETVMTRIHHGSARPHRPQYAAGFTLIELMIVIAILGILIAIALPAYQDYSIRTKNSECLSISAGAKLALAETMHSVADWNGDDAGYSFEASSYCQSVVIGATGMITATTQNTGAETLAIFTLTPVEAGGRIAWTCAETAGVPGSQLPATCR